MLVALFIFISFACGYGACHLLSCERLDLDINLIGKTEEEIESGFRKIKMIMDEFEDVRFKFYSCIGDDDEKI